MIVNPTDTAAARRHVFTDAAALMRTNREAELPGTPERRLCENFADLFTTLAEADTSAEGTAAQLSVVTMTASETARALLDMHRADEAAAEQAAALLADEPVPTGRHYGDGRPTDVPDVLGPAHQAVILAATAVRHAVNNPDPAVGATALQHLVTAVDNLHAGELQ